MVTRWEYRSVSPDFGEKEEHRADNWIDHLNALGAEGWEVVGSVQLYYQVSQHESLPVSIVLAKRPKTR